MARSTGWNSISSKCVLWLGISSFVPILACVFLQYKLFNKISPSVHLKISSANCVYFRKNNNYKLWSDTEKSCPCKSVVAPPFRNSNVQASESLKSKQRWKLNIQIRERSSWHVPKQVWWKETPFLEISNCFERHTDKFGPIRNELVAFVKD